MEQIRPQTFKHNLDKVLKSYQTVAMSSLGGPSSYSARWHAASSEALAIARKLAGLDSAAAPGIPTPVVVTDMAAAERLALSKSSETNTQPPKKSAAKYLDFDPLLHPPPFPIQQMPVFTPIDKSSGEKCETVLESETISCFIVGGEKRLCLPQILNSVLRDFSLQQINAVCEDLHIYCSRCSPEQLEILKFTGILPASAPSCGLITKTDAERLCNALLYGLTETRYMAPSPTSQGKRRNSLLQQENCFSVYHECFGKCKGTFIPDLYVSPHAPSIECFECQFVFTPQKFVMHSHKGKENRTCHWGFDSANWRSYLLVAKEQETDEKHQAALADMKAKFDFMSRFKRKYGFDENGNTKKIKVEEDSYSKDAIITSAWSSDGVPLQRPSAFRPWSPSALAKETKALPEHGTVLVRDSRGIPTYLSMGPPVLLNPERVVPHTAASNYDSHYAPNVTLAPPSKPETPNKSDSTESKDSSSDSREKSPESRGSPNHRKSWEGEGSTTTTMEQEIQMVRGMLESDMVSTQTGRDKLLHELARIRMQQEERLQSALAGNKDLRQELEFVRAAKKEKLREAAETKRSLRKENERLRSDYERRLRDLNDSKQHLKSELEYLRSSRGGRGPQDAGKERARLRAENEYMRDRLNAVEKERDELQQQLSERHRKSDGRSPGKKDVHNETWKTEEKLTGRNSVQDRRPLESPKSSPKTGTGA